MYIFEEVLGKVFWKRLEKVLEIEKTPAGNVLVECLPKGKHSHATSQSGS